MGVRLSTLSDPGGTPVIALTDTAAVKVQELITAEGEDALDPDDMPITLD